MIWMIQKFFFHLQRYEVPGTYAAKFTTTENPAILLAGTAVKKPLQKI